MAEAPANWFTCFPKDYRWSSSNFGMISCAQWRKSEIGEVDVDKVGPRLEKKPGTTYIFDLLQEKLKP